MIFSKNYFINFLFLFFYLGFSLAQESVNSSGTSASSSDGIIAYTIGQVVYTTNESASGKIAQGVQHTFEVYNIGINQSELNITISVFPNPINEKLILHILDFNFEKLTYHLYDVQGKQIIKEEIRSQTTILDTDELPSSVYFIDFLNSQNKKIQSFKVIKN